MRDYPYRIDGEPVTVRVIETDPDLADFWEWLDAVACLPVGVDSETTGLDIYADTHRLRTVQFGTEWDGWVIPVEKGQKYRNQARLALARLEHLVVHNASFDLQVFDRHLDIPMASLWPKAIDTKILAHLIDPRGQEEGGIGHSLESATAHCVDAEAAEYLKGIPTRLAKHFKTTKVKVWAVPGLIDHPEFHLYAGTDPILAVRLYRKLVPLVPEYSRHLIPYEHRLAQICSRMERTGFKLDVEYTLDLYTRLTIEEEEAVWHAETFFDIDSVNSTEQVAEALEWMGYRFKEFTSTGKRKVDKKLLESLLIDVPEVGSPAHLATAVTEAKRARKWRTTWIAGFLKGMDGNSRIHPRINPLRARTARMSITGIPGQTLPAGDWMVRRCFVADEGQTIASVDYKAQELRVLAALSGDPTMRKAFATDADLHQMTADASGVDRKIGKMVNFAYVYGSGPKNIAEQGGIPVSVAQKVIKGFEARYPKVKELSTKLQKEAKESGYVITPTGRRLPVDRDRGYSALNYMIQSTSRDITGRGLLNLHEAGFTPYLRLPVHDEVVASLPVDKARWGAAEIARHMRMDFRGVAIDTDPEIYGSSWGHGYMSDAEKNRGCHD
ncbi:DNA polymerase [Nocardia terpenica]|uniref:DNA polymerase I n=1 Tax=Nocardia terpenica TaxID=455432 RepID=A0A291RTS6_9NOCA|nr:DNA polymerase [Nocardia terpenica]ATL70745.1 DNA polymerase [Nocardia terpenica]